MNVTTYDNALLVSRDDIQNECRPTSADEALVNRCIEEAQMLDVKPQIGDGVYLRLFDASDTDAQALWTGGKYEDGCGNAHIFAGLKKALLYYSYARLVRSQGGTSTRFDFVVKADQYSDSADLKEKIKAYNDAFAIADGYMAQCLAFMACNADAFAVKGRLTQRNNRISIKKIGY